MKHVVAPAFGITLILLLFSYVVEAQSDPPGTEPGGVTAATFAPTAYAIDSSANAVYLLDHGEITYDPSFRNLGYCVIFERHVQIRILKQNALNLATLSISAYHHNNVSTYIDEFRGATYNLVDGKVVATKVDKSNIFNTKNPDYDIEKVAFPNVGEGSVIDYMFRVVYPGFGFIPEWEFQQSYPVLWSEYEVTVPVVFDYFVRNQGYRPFTIDTTLYGSARFPIGFSPDARGIYDGPTVHRIWALQDVRPLEKAELYTTTLRNHIQKVSFQLSAIRFGSFNKTFHTTWPQLTGELLRNPNFGDALTDKNHWMDDELQKIAPKDDHSLATAQKLYDYVRDQFTCTGERGVYLSQPIRKTWEDKKGTVPDVNILLTAIYRHWGFEASPVLLSTREHGYPVEAFPMLNDYNYVITRVRVANQYYLLDASRPTTGFNQLPERCYNSTAWAIDSSHDALSLLPDSVTEHRITRVFLSNDTAGSFGGSYSRTLGVFESMEMRNRLKREKPADFFDNLRKSTSEHREMGEAGFDSLGNTEQPLSWHYEMTYHFNQKTLYFYPIMHERMTTNPLAEPDRTYPVEMPYRVDNLYVLSMDVPKGYTLDQLPKSARYTLEDSSCYFEYMITSDGKTVNFNMRLQLRKTTFPVSEYSALRDFYALVVQKEKEPIIFKKIN
jgi:hypothetical protein